MSSGDFQQRAPVLELTDLEQLRLQQQLKSDAEALAMGHMPSPTSPPQQDPAEFDNAESYRKKFVTQVSPQPVETPVMSRSPGILEEAEDLRTYYGRTRHPEVMSLCLQAVLEDMRVAIAKFRYYAECHRAKGYVGQQKAEANDYMATQLERTVQRVMKVLS